MKGSLQVFHDLLFLLGGLGDLCARSVFSAKLCVRACAILGLAKGTRL